MTVAMLTHFNVLLLQQETQFTNYCIKFFCNKNLLLADSVAVICTIKHTKINFTVFFLGSSDVQFNKVIYNTILSFCVLDCKYLKNIFSQSH